MVLRRGMLGSTLRTAAFVLAATLLALLLFAAIAPSGAGAKSMKAHCGQTGDFCYGLKKNNNGRVKLMIDTFSFRGKYRICVNPPEAESAHVGGPA